MRFATFASLYGSPVTDPRPSADGGSGSDEELAALWRDAATLLHTEGLPQWNCMVLNHGDFQNHAHLHLKIKIHKPHWALAMQRWEPARLELFSRLQAWVATHYGKDNGGASEVNSAMGFLL